MAMLLVGCAGFAPRQTGSEVEPAPTPTAACPEVEGVELPPECAPYDPDHAMAQNDRYRERMELSEDSRAAAEPTIKPIRTALETLRTDGALSVDSVEQALTDAGLTSARLRGDSAGVLFGASAPAGGCVFGEVSAEVLTVEAGGPILDGGCLPAQ